jgi:alpha/beta superfamily hydrolase
MHTKAVFRAAQALNEVGFHVLRFNFRGVGASTGVHDHGVGEQEDARIALDWMAEAYPELPLLLGGFSFGSVVALRVGPTDPRVKALLALGLPVVLRDLGRLGHEADRGARPLLIVQGEEDEFGDGTAVAAYAEGLGGGVTLARIPGAGHFFHEDMEGLKEAIRTWFTGPVGGAAFPVHASAPGS